MIDAAQIKAKVMQELEARLEQELASVKGRSELQLGYSRKIICPNPGLGYRCLIPQIPDALSGYRQQGKPSSDLL